MCLFLPYIPFTVSLWHFWPRHSFFALCDFLSPLLNILQCAGRFPGQKRIQPLTLIAPSLRNTDLKQTTKLSLCVWDLTFGHGVSSYFPDPPRKVTHLPLTDVKFCCSVLLPRQDDSGSLLCQPRRQLWPLSVTCPIVIVEFRESGVIECYSR